MKKHKQFDNLFSNEFRYKIRFSSRIPQYSSINRKLTEKLFKNIKNLISNAKVLINSYEKI